MGRVCSFELCMSVMQEKGPFSMFTVHVESKWVLCVHVCIYLSAIKLFGWPEIGQRLWFQSKDVRHLNVLYRGSCLNTPPSIWCRLIIRVERRAGVCGGHLFFPIPPSHPSSLRPFWSVWQFARVQSSERRKCSCQWCSLLSVSRWELQYRLLITSTRI